MGVDRLLFPRPEETRLAVGRQPVEANCPSCGSSDVRRYPVANFIGPKMVTKCQSCFHHVAVEEPKLDEAWPPWRSPTQDWV